MASLAITIDGTPAAEALFCAARTLSARLIPEIDHLLKNAGIDLQQIDLFAAATGPGSFTGVRAGIATIQGLALATGKQCVPFSSLAALAMNLPLSRIPVCPMLDARKGEVYAALYDCSADLPTPTIDDIVLPPAEFIEGVRNTIDGEIIFVGEGAIRYRDLIIEMMGAEAIIAPPPYHIIRAVNGAWIAGDSAQNGGSVEPSILLPTYLRASEAEYAKIDQQKRQNQKQP